MNKQVWNGEGLPPVGTVCEIKRVNDWLRVTIRFISDCHTVFVTDGETEACYQTCALQFRPTPTPEQIEAERRERISNAFLRAFNDARFSGGWKGSDSLYTSIYDAIRAGKIEGVKIDD
ncbi:hypothetical protein [Serratia sp. UGAL515B_01]|uniref:hypothetical protein n=1 Tax=Serratia sp. UGAL515B_01 TaxID=2986763 RepID=UPI002955C424|nr:hypothetical protein [Serratia sp. UGAL515B_01]WON77557.1 hypothetical protein OK023_02290 [Serratia sp. UGAL515B_01]